nr:hypothetical protein [Tanacetum cinerariifolium]
MTLEGVNTRVTELAAVQEQDTQNIYRVMEDTQGRQTEIFQRVKALVDDSQYHYETGRLVDQEARYSQKAWAYSIGLKGEGSGAPTKPQPIPSPTHLNTGDQPSVTESSSSYDTTQDSKDSLEDTNGSEGDQGRKKDKRDKPKPTLDNNTLDDLDADHDMNYMDTKEPVNERRLSEETEELVSIARLEDSTVRPDVGTVDPIVPPPTTTNVKVARLLYEEELAELERKNKKRQREEEASKATIDEMYNEVQERIKADALFVAKLQQEKRKEYTIEERAKFLGEIIVAQR